ncbi:hypothetical protein ABIE85_002141 [Bradyrhizobium diazoefficiens]|jgi:hypothetical protein|uniref:hypothetical protein n=1 Tax=Bradyrhizobium diazoefficiens TaxID=1355477 RepID=UPI002729821D|nr:hypothetical protein [Bradyrhizobium diazoefficiens]WLA60911.1 hypothetical protein QIH81_20275 [Bradyrhizobium diazoefficiens]
MHRFQTRSNIDHYLGVLYNHDLSPHDRSVVTMLLVAEGEKLSIDLGDLEFAELRAASGRERLTRSKQSRDVSVFGAPEREQADRTLVNVENTQTQLEHICDRLRAGIASSRK